jgi:hypothetical protein
MTSLLDTDVLIECLRATPQAQTWLNVVAGLDVQAPYPRS